MLGDLLRVFLAGIIIASLAVSAPLVQPDLAGPTSAGGIGGEYGGSGPAGGSLAGIAESLYGSQGSDSAGATGEEAPGQVAGGSGGENEPLQGEAYDSEDRERLRSVNGSDSGEGNGSVDGSGSGEGNGSENGSGSAASNISLEGGSSTLQYGAVKEPYWRQQAYDIYTAVGWRQSGSTQPFEDRIEPTDTANRRSYTIELAADATAIPAPFRPVATDLNPSVRRGPEGGIQTTDPIPAGTTFTVTSDVPDWSYEELKSAPASYDDQLIEQYGTPADSTPERVAELTDEITANASTPYQQAVAIEYWLKNEKTYSLEVPPPREDIVDQFLFEMDAGYCAYFATAMTEMLRTQGIPARYVTGFARNNSRVNGVERITQNKAHAWTEVYFEGVGWVKFEPTTSRRSDEGSSDDSTTISLQHIEPADPSALIEENEPPNQPNLAFATEETATDEDWEIVEADVELLTAAIPGTKGTVRVMKNGVPLVDHRVTFNGERVGLTDSSGEVTGELPYTETVSVTVYRYTAPGEPTPEETTTEPNESDSEEQTTTEEDDQSGEQTTTEEDTGSGDQTTTEAGTGSGGQATTEEPTTTTPEPPTTAAGDSTSGSSGESTTQSGSDEGSDGQRENGGESGPGGSVGAGSLQASQEAPVGGSLTLGEPRTVFLVYHNRSSTVSSLREGQWEPPETQVNLRPVQTEAPVADLRPLQTVRNVSIPLQSDASVRVDGQPLQPGGTATVTATVGGNPIPDGTVRVGDETYKTDENGTATITVPYATEATIEFERGDVTGQTTVRILTDVSVHFVTDPIPGTTATVEANTEQGPVSNLTVRANGVAIDRTNVHGQAGIPVPYAETLVVNATAQRVTGETTVQLPTELTVDAAGLPIPGLAVDANVTISREPVENATITTAEGAYRTDGNGTAAVQIPLVPRQSLDMVAEKGVVQGSTSINLLPVWLAMTLGSILSIGFFLWRIDVRQLGRHARTRGEASATYLRSLARSVVTGLIHTATWIAKTAKQSGKGTVASVLAVFKTAHATGKRLTKAIPKFGSRLQSGALRRFQSLNERVAGTVSWMRVGPDVWKTRLKAFLVGLVTRSQTQSATARADQPSETETAAEQTRRPIDIVLETWEWVVAIVKPESTLTPGEIANRAVESGFPERPVRRILHGFRRVRYGHKGVPSADRSQLSEAEQTLRAAGEDEE